MQNQKTAKATADISVMELNPEEQVFAEALAVGGTQADAYRKAYGAEGYSLPALHVAACRKAAQTHIRAYIAALRAAGAAKGKLSLEQRIEEERAFAQECKNEGNLGAAGAAYDRLNKLLGLYSERLVIEADSDPAELLRQIHAKNPEVAEVLAKQRNIEWPPNDLSRSIN